ncbi:MAG: hypothetical protein AB7K24_00260 [Gemmataceae bacterium]
MCQTVVLSLLILAGNVQDINEPKLVGTWEPTVIRKLNAATLLPAAETQKHRIILTADTLTIMYEGKVLTRGTYTLAQGGVLLLKVTEGTDKGVTVRGAYEFDGDQLKLSLARLGFVLKRVKTQE